MSITPHKSFKRPFTVCIEGNIGSGKTTFLSHFKKYNNTTILQEPVDLWRDVAGTNLLELMYTKPTRYTFLFQSYVQLTMMKLHTSKNHLPYKIMERSVYSARIFIENMKRNKMLHNVEFVVLEEWYDWCLKNICIDVDLIVYLRTSPEVVYERMQARARKEETSVSLEYLRQIHDIHDEWLYHQTLFEVPAPVITLNGDQDLENMVIEFEKCKNQIFTHREAKVNGEEAVNTNATLLSSRGLHEIKAGGFHE